MRGRWLSATVVLLVGAVLGAGAILGGIAVNRHTSTDAFCGSCHSMAFIATDAYFQRSGHRSNSAGVRPSCGDCHIPRTNWFIETYTHVASGTRDVIAELMHDFADAKTWEARRIALAHVVRAAMARYLYDPLGSSLFDAICRSPARRAIDRAPCSRDGRQHHARDGAGAWPPSA